MAETKKNVENPAAENPETEMVTCEFFYDGERYKDDIFARVNGKTWQIKRGVPVTIPKYVYEMLMQSNKQNARAAEVMAEYQRKFIEQAQRI